MKTIVSMWCQEFAHDGEEIRVWAVDETTRKSQLLAAGSVDPDSEEMTRLGQ